MPVLIFMKKKEYFLIRFRRFILLRVLATISVVGISSCQQRMSDPVKNTTSSQGKDSINKGMTSDTIKRTNTLKLKKQKEVNKTKPVPKADTTYRVSDPTMDYGVLPYYPGIQEPKSE